MNAATVRVYSLSKNGIERPYMANGKRCTNFTVKEFACHDGTDAVFIDPQLVTLLQKVRDHWGKAVNVRSHSAYRTPQHNKSVGGERTSYHLYGRAADFHVVGVPNQEVYDYIDGLYPRSCGLGIYSWGIHIDTRSDRSRWKG